MPVKVVGATDRTIRAIKKAANLKTDITSGRPRIGNEVPVAGLSIIDTFFAKIVAPATPPDFTDARYYVSPISFAEDGAGVLTITVDTTKEFVAHNIAELSGIYGTDPDIERHNLRKEIILKTDALNTAINDSVGTGDIPTYYVYVYVLNGAGTQNTDGAIYIFSLEAPRIVEMDDILIEDWTASDCPDTFQPFNSFQQIFSIKGFNPSP